MALLFASAMQKCFCYGKTVMKRLVGAFLLFCALLALGASFAAHAQTAAQPAQTPQQSADKAAGQQQPAVPDAKGSAKVGNDQSTSANPNGENAASTQRLRLGALDPSTPPKDLPHNRPVIGLAMGGGGAVAMSEIGAL